MKILLGVTGSISAYKACDVVSGLVATNNEVQVVMTPQATRFAPVDTLSVLSEKPVLIDSLSNEPDVHHVELVMECDIIIIVPTTFNTINKISCGVTDNLLLDMCAVAGGSETIKAIFPAMNNNMLNNSVLKENVRKLETNGWIVNNTRKGVLACGAVGYGKLLKPRKIVEIINSYQDSLLNSDE